MGGMTVTEVDAGNIIVPPRQRKVNPIKEKILHRKECSRDLFQSLNDVNLVQLDRADDDGSDIDEWSLDMTRGEYFLEF